MWSIHLFFITYDNYDYRLWKSFGTDEKMHKFCTRKCKKYHYVYCDYKDISMIYINSDHGTVEGKKPLNDNLQLGFGQ